MDEPLEGHLPYPFPADSKLRAAYARYRGRQGCTRMYLLPDMPSPVNLLGLVKEVEVDSRPIHMYPVRAAGFMVAAHIHVALARNTVVVEAFDYQSGVEAQKLIVVPRMMMGVHE